VAETKPMSRGINVYSRGRMDAKQTVQRWFGQEPRSGRMGHTACAPHHHSDWASHTSWRNNIPS